MSSPAKSLHVSLQNVILFFHLICLNASPYSKCFEVLFSSMAVCNSLKYRSLTWFSDWTAPGQLFVSAIKWVCVLHRIFCLFCVSSPKRMDIYAKLKVQPCTCCYYTKYIYFDWIVHQHIFLWNCAFSFTYI